MANERFGDQIRIEPLAADHWVGGARVTTAIRIAFINGGSVAYRRRADVMWLDAPAALVLAPGAVDGLEAARGASGWILEVAPSVLGMHDDAPGRFRAGPDHPSWLSFLRPACISGEISLPPEAARAWALIGMRIANELEQRPSGYRQAISASVALILLDVARLALPGITGTSLRSEPVLAQTFDVIERRFDQPISLDDVAAEVALSSSHLARTVRRLTDRTVNEWIVQRRMVEARRLLLETDLKVDAVARRSGFTDTSHFRRQFRREHGSAWRDRTRGWASADQHHPSDPGQGDSRLVRRVNECRGSADPR